MNLAKPREIARAAKTIPVSLVVFDLLWLDGHDTTGLALEQRRELLELICETDHRLQVVTHVEGEGTAFVETAHSLGLEGVVAKRLGSRYVPGQRSPDWRKIKLRNTQDCVILGWTPGARAGVGFARRAARRRDRRRRRWAWIGQVGSGFTSTHVGRSPDEQLRADRARPTRRSTTRTWRRSRAPPSSSPTSSARCEYLEMTKSTNKMRAPSFKGMRPDKLPDECVLERPQKGS